MCVCIYLCLYSCLCVYLCVYSIFICIFISISIFILIFTFISISLYVSIFIFIFIYIYIWFFEGEKDTCFFFITRNLTKINQLRGPGSSLCQSTPQGLSARFSIHAVGPIFRRWCFSPARVVHALVDDVPRHRRVLHNNTGKHRCGCHANHHPPGNPTWQ